ncbi:MAG: ABC transporter permease [Candidatus Krumholzibacteriota bacterium]|nr:ABC transporter permease [Candidatus Krumholzibacteriota bacterium]
MAEMEKTGYISCLTACSGRNGRNLSCRGSSFFDDRIAVISMILILFIITISAAAPLMTPYGCNDIDLDNISALPTAEHLLGTDDLGRDLFSRLLYGGRYTLLVAFLTVMISTLIGMIMGSLAGYFGGYADRIVSSLTDLFLSVPVFLVLMVLASFGRGHLWLIPLVIGGGTWMETSRVVRSRLIQLKEEEFVAAARLLGGADMKIIFKHLLPQAAMPVTVSAVVGFASAILIESSLSFLGFGVQPPVPSWGNMLHNAQMSLRVSPVSAFAPGFLIFMAALAFNFIGAGLKRSLAPGGE